MNCRDLKRRFLFVELFVGILSVILGGILTWLVRGSGYYPGALMLMVTGALTLILGVWEIKTHVPESEKFHLQNLFRTILRRAFFFLNLMLSSLVLGTLCHFPGFPGS